MAHRSVSLLSRTDPGARRNEGIGPAPRGLDQRSDDDLRPLCLRVLDV
ncbi:hypothetical protein AB0F91_02805 [Amycolatopsis sp. NPDC023774]